MTSLLVIVLGLAGLAALWFGLPHLWRKRQERRLAELCRKERVIVLSYDDGPGAATTPRLADLLARHEAPATFFVLGRAAERHPGVVGDLIAQNHEVGSHTLDHTNAWKSAPATALRDAAAGRALVDRMGGQGALFRPPFGKMTLGGLLSARRRGIELGWWTVDSRDSWQRRPVEEVVDEIERAGGGVVLMHDGDAYEKSGAGHTDYVLALTERILEHARAGGYRLMRLGELLDRAKAQGHG